MNIRSKVFMIVAASTIVLSGRIASGDRQPGMSRVAKILREVVLLAGKKFADGKEEVSRVDFDTEDFSLSISAKPSSPEFAMQVRRRTKVTENFFIANFVDFRSDGIVGRAEVTIGTWEECCDLESNPYLPEYGPQEAGYYRKWQDEYDKLMICCFKELSPADSLPILADSRPSGQQVNLANF